MWHLIWACSVLSAASRWYFSVSWKVCLNSTLSELLHWLTILNKKKCCSEATFNCEESI